MIYEWKCAKCSKITEVTCTMAERDNPPPADTSPENTCEHEWRRLLTTGGFVLQGGGWAKDSYSSGLKVTMS